MDDYKELFNEFVHKGRITKSINNFKIKLFLNKVENSLLIARHVKEIKPKQGKENLKSYIGIIGQ